MWGLRRVPGSRQVGQGLQREIRGSRLLQSRSHTFGVFVELVEVTPPSRESIREAPGDRSDESLTAAPNPAEEPRFQMPVQNSAVSPCSTTARATTLSAATDALRAI